MACPSLYWSGPQVLVQLGSMVVDRSKMWRGEHLATLLTLLPHLLEGRGGEEGRRGLYAFTEEERRREDLEEEVSSGGGAGYS